MVSPYWRIWVDWNDNGIWDESKDDYREDVTGDVLELDWRWGKPVGTGSSGSAGSGRAGRSSRADRTEPARLSLTLGNQGQRYSPGNSSSPLTGNLSAGRRVWAAFAYPHDDFAGTNGTDLRGRIAPGGGPAWSRQSAGAAGFALQDGTARPTAGSGGAIYTLDFGDADAHVGFRYRRSGNGVSGVALRCRNRWDYLRVRFGSSGTFLEDVTFGYPSTLRRGDALSAGVNYLVEIEMHGSAVRLYATDLDAGAMERKEILDGGGNAGNGTAGEHGLWHDGSATAANDVFAEFGGWRSFFCGALTRISPELDPELGPVCRCLAGDDLYGLGRLTLYNLLNSRNLSTGAIANGILTWAGFSPNYRRVAAGRTLIATEPRALWRVSAEAALESLAEEENGLIYMDGRGYFRLESAGHRQAAPHTAIRATLRDTSAVGPYFTDLVWDEGRAGMENAVTFRYRRGDNKGLQEIWRLGDVPVIPAGASRDFLAESGAYAVVDSIRAPAANTDYTGNSHADGQGTDLTGSLTVTLPYATGNSPVTGAAYRGRGTVVRVANGHATMPAYLTKLQLRADRAYAATEPTSYLAENAVSRAAHGLYEGGVECRYIDNYDAARQGAEARLTQKGLPRVRLTLAIPGGGGDNAAQIVHRVISDRVRVICGNPSLDGNYYVEGMEVSARGRTGEVKARWRLEDV